MRLNRGILALGITATLITLGNAYATIIFYVLICMDSCTDLGSLVSANGLSGLTPLLLPSVLLVPSLALILSAWIWMLVELRRLQAARLLAFGYIFPVIALVAGLAISLLTSVNAQGGLTIYPFNVWNGSFALALWPLLVTLVAIFWRGPTRSEALPPPARTASDSA